jgi:hypothetical protein
LRTGDVAHVEVKAAMIRGGLAIAMSENSSIVWATEAIASDDYFCARCGSTMILNSKDHSFQHPDSFNCSAILAVQKAALMYMHDLLSSGDASPVQVRTRCNSCERPVLIDLNEDLCRCSFLSAEDGKEALLLESSRLRALVMVRPASPFLCQQAHSLGAYWLEIDARNLFTASVVDVLAGTLPPCLCDLCDDRQMQMREQILDTAARHGTEFDTTKYRARVQMCSNCQERILHFRWNGHQTWANESPPKPVPLSIQWRWSYEWNEYCWMNTCPACGEIQTEKDSSEDHAGW